MHEKYKNRRAIIICDAKRGGEGGNATDSGETGEVTIMEVYTAAGVEPRMVILPF